MTEATIETKWLPSHWQDECIPEPQSSPDGFLRRVDEGSWVLRDPGGDWQDIPVKHGEVVRFDANRVYGDFCLTVDEDGSFDTDGGIPADANCFRLDRDTDTLAESLFAIVENGDGERLGPGTYDIDAYHWSGPFFFRLEVVVDTARFIRVEGAA